MFGIRFDLKFFSGLFLVTIFAVTATLISKIEIVKSLGLSPLVIGIVLGILYANTIEKKMPNYLKDGIIFSAKKILRFAIVIYGFRLTFGEVIDVGIDGFLVSLIMLTSTLLIGVFAGIKIFKMDKDTSILTAAGASVCGAAAVLATEPVLKAKDEKVAVAVSMVVIFGTISMFLYPIIYESIIKPATNFFHMTPREFGIYVGGSIHEVAQVVAVPASIPNSPKEMADAAVIVKLTRVLLIAPMLIILGLILSYTTKNVKNKHKLVIPWFAVYFIFVVGFNSLNLLPVDIVNKINNFDTFMLTMAMSALGMGTSFAKFKGVGVNAFYTALIMFFWLIIGGFFITKAVTSL